MVYLLNPANRIHGLLLLAGLPDPSGIFRHLTRNRCLPLLNRWSTEDNIRVHHGQPLAQCHSDGLVSPGLHPIGYPDTWFDRRDVHLRSALSGLDFHLNNAGPRIRNADGRSDDVPTEISQRQRG